MTYSETIDFMYSQLPMFTRIGAAAYKKDLHNTTRLSQAFDNPERKFKTIHVAGTNGKGSTSHMLAAIFQTAGYKTGLYTSPHLKDFRERIRINGEWIREDFVIDFVKNSQQLIEEIKPSFFELTVVMAFEYFAREKVDIAIIETGLGGRLDSTNIITPELSIITNIGWDHMNLLGDTLEKIATEKAGIIKQYIPVVVGETLPTTRNVFKQKASQETAFVVWAEDQYEVANVSLKIDELIGDFTNQRGETITIHCDLPGIYQQKNICTVLTAVDVLKKNGHSLTDANVRTALKQVKKLNGLHGRWELVHHDPYVILDVGHNEDGVKQIIRQLKVTGVPPSSVKIIVGVVKDKEVDKVLQLFPSTYRFYFTNAHIPRAMMAAELQEKAAGFGLHGNVYNDVNDAIKNAIVDAAKEDLIIVCGSVFVVGEVDVDFLMSEA
ncbi:MAG: folylpolyglutamate synthase/dihydrofolate synthase family protein [Chitinophagaceae bacterium]